MSAHVLLTLKATPIRCAFQPITIQHPQHNMKSMPADIDMLNTFSSSTGPGNIKTLLTVPNMPHHNPKLARLLGNLNSATHLQLSNLTMPNNSTIQVPADPITELVQHFCPKYDHHTWYVRRYRPDAPKGGECPICEEESKKKKRKNKSGK